MAGKTGESVCAECLARWIFAEPEVVVTLIRHVPEEVCSCRATAKESDGTSNGLLLRWEVAKGVVLGGTHPYVPLTHSEITS
jgi:hypothetical protein